MRLTFLILFIVLLSGGFALKAQTPASSADSVTAMQQLADSVKLDASKNALRFKQLLEDNYLLNIKASPVQQPEQVKKGRQHFYFFYILLGLALFLGIVRAVNSKYFNTLFRVFLNTSLRQSQLTDQLEQAKLLSLFYNTFFCINFGLLLYLLVENYLGRFQNVHWLWLQYCILVPFFIYFLKYIILLFIGWVSGYKEEVNIYIFITFLINKIMGIILLPFIFLVAFADKIITGPAIILTIVIIILLFILRYFRSYNLLQHRLKFSRIHFFLFIFGLEIVPLLILYKAATYYLSINQ